jgi:predicted SAM-dependent methyltransferase
MIKINLGSGPRTAKDWINFDYGLLPFLGKFGLTKIAGFLGMIDKSYVVKWPRFRYFDIRQSLPFGGDSVDYIYCSHVLEHFEKYEVLRILTECRRVLGRKGLVRIVMPDLLKLISDYSGSDSFCREFYGYDKDLMGGVGGSLKKYFIRGHRWMYDVEEFCKLLKCAGFSKVSVVSYRQGSCPDLDVLDLDIHLRLSFYVEARA